MSSAFSRVSTPSCLTAHSSISLQHPTTAPTLVPTGDSVVDVSGAVSALEGRSSREFMTLLISDWDSFKPGIEALVAAGDGVPLSSVTLCPSVPRPGQLVCMAGNFIEPGRPAGQEVEYLSLKDKLTGKQYWFDARTKDAFWDDPTPIAQGDAKIIMVALEALESILKLGVTFQGMEQIT